jgi:muramoyltetrapeptide carboxypeptidase
MSVPLTRRESLAATLGCLLLPDWADPHFAGAAPASESWISPPALRPGDTVRFVAPASPVDMDKVRQAEAVLGKIGLRVSMPTNLARQDGYLAGSDEQRSRELNAAIRDPHIAAIFPCRGGYGLTRILDRLDYRRLRANPKIIVGFSDITALHLAVARQARVVTFHSAMPQFYLWDESEKYAFSAESLWRTIMPGAFPKPRESAFVVETPDTAPQPRKLTGGCARGRLVGGNLTLISITLGTPYAIEPAGNLLILEDVDEPPQKIDRYFSQLRLAGVLDAVSGILMGTFIGSSDEHSPRQYRKEIEQLVNHYCANLGIPVVMDFPVGHTPYNVTIPLGAPAELDADRTRLTILDDPVAQRAT